MHSFLGIEDSTVAALYHVSISEDALETKHVVTNRGKGYPDTNSNLWLFSLFSESVYMILAEFY